MKIIDDLAGMKSTVDFYRFNPHSIPGIRHLLCMMGRHDYEAMKIDHENDSVILECFYCLHTKSSGLPKGHDT